MLSLTHCGIADAHRSVAAIAFEVRRGPLVDLSGRHDAVKRPQLLIRLRRDRNRERYEFFHGARRADAIERLDDEIGVAQPAIAVVPGAPGARRFRYRGGVRGDDTAGLVEIAELERDRRADNGFLPIVGDRQPAHPFHPIIACAIGEVAAGRLQIARERLVRAKNQMQRARQDERCLAVNQRQRRVGGQPDDRAFAGIADVVAAKRALLQRLAVVAGRTHADGDARQAADRLDDAKNLRRTKHAAELTEARDEIGDLDLAALVIGQRRRDDRRIAHVFRLIFGHVVEHDVGKALLLLAGQQAAENRIAVEARIAPPHEPRGRIDQCGRASVSDDGKIKPVVFHQPTSLRSAAIRASQVRTSSGRSK